MEKNNYYFENHLPNPLEEVLELKNNTSNKISSQLLRDGVKNPFLKAY